MVLHINELAAARAGADLKEAWAGGGRLCRERGAERRAQSAAHSDSPEAPTDGGSGSQSSREARYGQREATRRRLRPLHGRAGRPPRVPALAPGPSGQHEAPDGRAAPAAPGAVRRARGR